MGMELVFGLGALLLGGAMMWAMPTKQQRSARNRRIGAAVVRERYRHFGSPVSGRVPSELRR
jgi:hypothetical protein